MSKDVRNPSQQPNNGLEEFLTEIQQKNLRYAKYAFILAFMNYTIALFSPQILLLGDALVNLYLIDIYTLAPNLGKRLIIFEGISVIFAIFNIYIYHYNRRLQYPKVRLNSTIAIGSASIAAIEIMKLNTIQINTIFTRKYVGYVSTLGLAFYALILANLLMLVGVWVDKYLRMPSDRPE